MKITCLLMLFSALCASSEADYHTHFLWYRAEPEFSRIVVTDEVVYVNPHESRLPLFNFFKRDEHVVVLQGGKLVSKAVKPKQESKK
jgi:hypothetical protein